LRPARTARRNGALRSAELDSGPIIEQASVPVLPGDTPDTLAARVLEVEHRIYPLALRRLAEGRA
jgi:phosphoribosylglycinamide formyltransferase-1